MRTPDLVNIGAGLALLLSALVGCSRPASSSSSARDESVPARAEATAEKIVTPTPVSPVIFASAAAPAESAEPAPAEATQGVAEVARALAEAFASSLAEDRALAFDTLLSALVAQDPEAAARVVTDIENEDIRRQALDRLARLWTARDPVAALRWADAMPFVDERDLAVVGISLEIATRSVPDAIEVLSTYESSERPLAALADLAQTWADTDLPRAKTWALGLEPSVRREGLVARVAYVQAKTEPAAAAELALIEIPTGESQNEALISVLHQWGARDVEAAAGWAATLEPGPFRTRALQELRSLAPPSAANGAP